MTVLESFSEYPVQQPAHRSLAQGGTSSRHRLTERLAAAALIDEEDEATPTDIAERFSPQLSPEPVSPEPHRHKPRELSEIDETELLAAPLKPHEGRAGISRGFLALLVVLALLPSVSVASLTWFGEMTPPKPHARKAPHVIPASAVPQPRLQRASLVTAPPPPLPPVPKPLHPEEVSVVLSSPSEVSLEPGKSTALDIAIDGTDGLPPRSMIEFDGLPENATLSAGRPFGGDGWSLRPDEIGDLSILLPSGTTGGKTVSIALLSPSGDTLAKTETRLTLASPAEAPILRPEERARIAELIQHGQKMISVGYFAGARAYLRRAAEAGSGEAALALAATYEQSFIERLGAHGIKPDPQEAAKWRKRAEELGVKPSDPSLVRIDNPASTPPQQPQPQLLGKPAEPAAAPTETLDEWAELSSAANMRANPSSSASTIRVVQKGTRVHVSGRKGGWMQVTNAATQESGWIYERYISLASK